jgi:glucose/arabinose dehydrogenase
MTSILRSILLTCATLLPTTWALCDNIGLQKLYPELKLKKPLQVTLTPQGKRLVLQQGGKIVMLGKDEAADKPEGTFLDLRERKLAADDQSDFEEGLLGLALHPKYAENSKCYVFYTQQDPKHAVVSEFKAGPRGADPASERILLTVDLPHWNHHGGNLVFGPDGLLYMGIGDGGGPQGGDPHQFSQNTFSHLGKILRIDVDKTTGNRAYGLPDGNPWLNQPGHKPENIALGIRQPWGMAFDSDGTLWFADVGQNLLEEVNLLQIGGNYGWNYREGDKQFPRRSDAPPEGTQFLEPIHTYGRDQGISITGGVHYYGKNLPQLQGCFIYGDWGSGNIWALKYDKVAKKVISNVQLSSAAASTDKASPPIKPTGFSLDEYGEVLVLDWSGGIYRLCRAKA